jgi:hypothetical protein
MKKWFDIFITNHVKKYTATSSKFFIYNRQHNIHNHKHCLLFTKVTDTSSGGKPGIFFEYEFWKRSILKKEIQQINSVAINPEANYTD